MDCLAKMQCISFSNIMARRCIMIRYGGWVSRTLYDDFLQDVVDADLVITPTTWSPEKMFYVIYFTNREDETYFRLKYPGLKKEIDNV